MDPVRVEEFLHKRCRMQDGYCVNRDTGRRVRAILPVHILGQCVDMAPILELANEFRLLVIEDATEALGSSYRGSHAGTIGDIGCFSSMATS